MDLGLVFTVLVTCMFQAHVHANNHDLEDVKEEAHLLSNVTTLVKSTISEQHENGVAALLETYALAQLDQLSLVTRYAGTGYNLVRGSPEGDFNYGGVDPGIRTTQEIFAHTYTT